MTTSTSVMRAALARIRDEWAFGEGSNCEAIARSALAEADELDRQQRAREDVATSCAHCEEEGVSEFCPACALSVCSSCFHASTDRDCRTEEDGEDEGCPVGDPDCTSRDDECHDACEAPAR